MYEINTQALSLQEAQDRFAEVFDLSPPSFEARAGRVFGFEQPIPIAPRCSRESSSIDTEMALFVWLPEHSTEQLRDLASAPFSFINLHSRNLLHALTFATIGPIESGLYVTAWGTDLFCVSGEDVSVRIVLIGSEAVVDAKHRFTGSDAEEFSLGGQAQMGSTGPNYWCERVYSDEELKLAAELGNDYDVPGLIVIPLKRATGS